MSPAPCILAVVQEPSLFASLSADLADLGVRTLYVASLNDSRLREERGKGSVIVCDADSTDWVEALRSFRRSQPSSPVVFLTRLADEHLWLEMLDAGAFDLLEKPYRAQDLRWVVNTALRHATGATTGTDAAVA